MILAGDIFMNLEELFTLKNLNEAFYEASKENKWKETTQRYQQNLLLNNMKLREEILSGSYRVSHTTDFKINERGKTRQIHAPAMRDRIFQKVLTKKLLTPAIRPLLIYDNSASLKDRGTSFARKRVEIMLREFHEKYPDGVAGITDIHDYFGSVDHERLKEKLRRPLRNVPLEIMRYVDYSVDTEGCEGKGLNLGGECPQIYAVFYLSDYDNFFKIVKSVKEYKRYMDDAIFLSPSKEEARELIEDAKEQLKRDKLELNERKTQIVKISHGFTYLKTKYSFENGKLITRPTHDKIVRERRRLKGHARLREKGLMEDYEVKNNYLSWRMSVEKDYNSCDRTLKEMDNLFNELFPNLKPYKKKTRTDIINNAFKEASYEDLQYFW